MNWSEVVDFHAYDRRISVYRLEEGEGIPSHAHLRWGHKLIVADGLVRFTKELYVRELEGPTMVSVDPNVEHEVVAMRRSIVISIFGEDGSWERS